MDDETKQKLIGNALKLSKTEEFQKEIHSMKNDDFDSIAKY